MHRMKLHLRTPLTGLFAAAVWCIGIAASPAATITNLYNTGVNNAGVPLGAAGLPDPHYNIVFPNGYTAITVDDTVSPIPPWYANNATSRWIGPSIHGDAPGGTTYVYQTVFSIPLTAILSTVSISGQWATDDFGTDIRINGTPTGQTSPGFSGPTPFAVNSGFIYGFNTLRFFVANAFPGIVNPTGLRVDKIVGTYQVVPEPATAFLTTVAALLAIVLCRRLRRFSSASNCFNTHASQTDRFFLIQEKVLMHASPNRLIVFLSMVVAGSLLATQSQADPLPGRDLLKFAQEPMVATTITNTTGQTGTFFGHDELSTAYGVTVNGVPPLNYQGTFMADDFADNLSTPVVHVKWWGSYIDDNFAAAPQPHVKKFLIAFETDIPNGPGGFSMPGAVQQFAEVNYTPGALTQSSGLFTETLVPRPTGDPLNEPLYEYNAELPLGHEFLEQKDTVYWLKIAALVDVQQPVLAPVPPGTTQWGWHNRDYTIQDTLASPVPNPGERDQGPLPGTTTSIWHFQDDAVRGDLRYTPGAPVGQQVIQLGMSPQPYVGFNSQGIGPLDGPPVIAQFSKDLAFRLYTLQPNVPEPATCVLLIGGSLGLTLTRRRRG